MALLKKGRMMIKHCHGLLIFRSVALARNFETSGWQKESTTAEKLNMKNK